VRHDYTVFAALKEITMQQYEVEIKTLLGSKENAERLKSALMKLYPDSTRVGYGKQLNHYFNTPSDISSFKKKIETIIPRDKKSAFENIMTAGKKISLRTRDSDGKVILVVKASVGDDTSSNGVKRIEFEAVLSQTLDELDALVIDSGATYQAKWSREREEYASVDMHICIDKNAGYGYVAEFEKVISSPDALETSRKELLSVMKKLGVEELPQERLERMFAHYNNHWKEYYGTDKTFIIK